MTEEERFIEVKTELRITIDRRLAEELGIPEDELRRYAESRLTSLAHRFSTWITETITSTLMLYKMRQDTERTTQTQEQPGQENTGGSSSLGTVEIVDINGDLFIKPNENYKKYSRSKGRYLKMGDVLIPLRLTSKRRVVNYEAIQILRRIMGDKKSIRLPLVEVNWNRIVIGLPGDWDAEGKNRNVQGQD